jgi:hypothetical protein
MQALNVTKDSPKAVKARKYSMLSAEVPIQQAGDEDARQGAAPDILKAERQCRQPNPGQGSLLPEKTFQSESTVGLPSTADLFRDGGQRRSVAGPEIGEKLLTPHAKHQTALASV